MVNQQDQLRLQELADFLRTRRARLTPEYVGLPRGNRRRSPGLKRMEVAQLAGVCVDWYPWLEQGRSITASVEVLESLVKALRLDPDEREHLFFPALSESATLESIFSDRRTMECSGLERCCLCCFWEL